MTSAVQLVGVHKAFGDVIAVESVDLDIADGEFFSLLGPSGSGKTTVLRMIAGFDQPTAGAILLHGNDVSRTPPYDRDVNTVFQDYALFPHMTVLQNVEYGLKVTGVGRAERRTRAVDMLHTVRLGDLGGRRPNQLSGGQRQRVALARALVNRPSVLLLDEPLGALDLKLREEMQTELKLIQREVGITFIFVTHDQGEALSMSSRVAVFNRGLIEQVGSPEEIYNRPATEFVARFVGTSNVFDAATSQQLFGAAGPHMLRPERVSLVPAGQADPVDRVVVTGAVVDVQFLGSFSRVRVQIPQGPALVASVPSDELAGLSNGTEVRLAWAHNATSAVATSA